MRRENAVALRRLGMSYKQIRRLVGGSMSSLSLWLRDIPLSEEQKLELRARGAANGYARGKANRERRLRKQAEIQRRAGLEVGSLTRRDLFIAGVVAYAAEGSKQKPWNTGSSTTFINSDPRMILLFLRWLSLIGVQRSALTFRVAIHETADATRAVRYWAHLVGVDEHAFMKTTLKRGNPRTQRHNVGRAYRGCLVVGVRRSTDLTRRIEGWFDAVVERSRASVDESLFESSLPRQPLRY